MSTNNRNIFVFVFFGCLWLTLVLVRYFWVGEQPMSDLVIFGLLPAILGVVVTLCMCGGWFKRLTLAASVPVIPILIFLVIAFNAPDPEAFAFFLYIGLGAITTYWVSTLLVSFILSFQYKKLLTSISKWTRKKTRAL